MLMNVAYQPQDQFLKTQNWAAFSIAWIVIVYGTRYGMNLIFTKTPFVKFFEGDLWVYICVVGILQSSVFVVQGCVLNRWVKNGLIWGLSALPFMIGILLIANHMTKPSVAVTKNIPYLIKISPYAFLVISQWFILRRWIKSKAWWWIVAHLAVFLLLLDTKKNLLSIYPLMSQPLMLTCFETGVLGFLIFGFSRMSSAAKEKSPVTLTTSKEKRICTIQCPQCFSHVDSTSEHCIRCGEKLRFTHVTPHQETVPEDDPDANIWAMLCPLSFFTCILLGPFNFILILLIWWYKKTSTLVVYYAKGTINFMITWGLVSIGGGIIITSVVHFGLLSLLSMNTEGIKISIPLIHLVGFYLVASFIFFALVICIAAYNGFKYNRFYEYPFTFKFIK